MSVTVELKPGETVTTEDPAVVVAPELPPGRYRVRLVVETDAGAQSRPVHQRLIVRSAP